MRLKDNGNDFRYDIYDGAGHAFMRKAVAVDAGQPDIAAREKAFATMLEGLQELK